GPAQKCLTEWRKLDPDNIERLVCEAWFPDRNSGGTSWHYLGILDRNSRRETPEAREIYLRALKLDPSRADIRLRLANAYLGQQRDRDAAEAFKQVLKQQPDNPVAQLGLAQATLNRGEGKEATEMLRNFLEENPD